MGLLVPFFNMVFTGLYYYGGMDRQHNEVTNQEKLMVVLLQETVNG